MKYMIKGDVFKYGFGAFLRWTGAIPIERTAAHGQVESPSRPSAMPVTGPSSG